jgi:hypothetical protein
VVDEAALEKCLAELERAVADLQRRSSAVATSGNWLEKLTGSISDEAAFLQALEYGRALRLADRPPDEPCDKP